VTKTPALRINKLSFVGRNIEPAELDFPGALSFIYGASNTGKSFAVKAIDFMFGAGRELPAIIERRSYDSIHLYLQIGEAERVKLERAVVGGDFKHHSTDGTARTLAARHSRDNNTNLSNYLLGCLRVTGKEVAKDKSGTKKPLSFRDIVRFCITDETSIQSETSPVESGDVTLAPMERNTFKFLLTGEDDSALITQEKPKDFRMGKMAQLRIFEEMISQIDTEISEDYPDVEQLDKLGEDVADELKDIEQDIVAARASARSSLEQKRSLAKEIGADQQRVNDIAINQIITYYARLEGMNQEKAEQITFIQFMKRLLQTYREMRRLNHLIKGLFYLQYLVIDRDKPATATSKG
jgi:hypothetical protein